MDAEALSTLGSGLGISLVPSVGLVVNLLLSTVLTWLGASYLRANATGMTAASTWIVAGGCATVVGYLAGIVADAAAAHPARAAVICASAIAAFLGPWLFGSYLPSLARSRRDVRPTSVPAARRAPRQGGRPET